MEDAVVAEAVGMAKGALPDVGDALDVGVRVHRPDRARSQAIVVENPQRPNPHLSGIAIAIEGEVPADLQPAPVFLVELTVPARMHHRVPLGDLDAAL